MVFDAPGHLAQRRIFGYLVIRFRAPSEPRRAESWRGWINTLNC
jgi:hypothetical protein